MPKCLYALRLLSDHYLFFYRQLGCFKSHGSFILTRQVQTAVIIVHRKCECQKEQIENLFSSFRAKNVIIVALFIQLGALPENYQNSAEIESIFSMKQCRRFKFLHSIFLRKINIVLQKMVRISLQQSYHYKSFWSRIYVKDGLLKLRACQKFL